MRQFKQKTMRQSMKRSFAGFLALLCALGALGGFAAADDETPPQSAADRTVAQFLRGEEAEAAFDRMLTSSDYYADFFLPSGSRLSGVYSTLSTYVTLPEYAHAESAILRLSYSCSELLLADRSALTLYMNGVAFYSFPVAHNVGKTVVTVEVPVELLNGQYNLLEINGYLRISDDDEDGCIEDWGVANWLSIDDSSCLRVGYGVTDDWRMLAYYPYPYVSLSDRTGQNAAVAVSDTMADGELAAAMMIMADLGSEVATKNDILLSRLSGVQDRNMIYVGLASNTPDDLLALCSDVNLTNTSVLVRRTTYHGREALLVIAVTPEALMEGARLLCDQTRVKQITENSCVSTIGEAEAYLAARMRSGLTVQNEYTFQSFLGGGVSFLGPFHQESVVTLPVSSDYALASNAKFTLKIRYSENLNFDRALMTVYWGTVPMYSHKLSLAGAAGETLVFTTPADLVGTTGSTLTIAFELEIEDLYCTPRQSDMPWAYVTADSIVYLPMGETGALNLANRPAPFQRDGALNQVMVVTSDAPSSAELALLGNVMALMGAGCEGYGTLRVVRASAFNPSDANYHIITVGRPDQNDFIRGLQEHLYFPYTDDMSRFASSEMLALTNAYASQIGTMQLLTSPYSAERALLCVTAPNDAGIRLLTTLCGTERMRWSLNNDAIIIDSRQKISDYSFKKPSQVQSAQPTVIESIVHNTDSLRFTLIATSAMIITLICVVLVLLRIRARSRKENKD